MKLLLRVEGSRLRRFLDALRGLLGNWEEPPQETQTSLEELVWIPQEELGRLT